MEIRYGGILNIDEDSMKGFPESFCDTKNMEMELAEYIGMCLGDYNENFLGYLLLYHNEFKLPNDKNDKDDELFTQYIDKYAKDIADVFLLNSDDYGKVVKKFMEQSDVLIIKIWSEIFKQLNI